MLKYLEFVVAVLKVFLVLVHPFFTHLKKKSHNISLGLRGSPR